jgi:hypothetical protein
MPETRAACSLPPIAYMYLPNFVCEYSTWVMIAIITKIRMGTGIPGQTPGIASKLPWPMKL